MKERLPPHPTLAPAPGPTLVVVLDGMGLGPKDDWDALHRAHTPTLDRLFASPLFRSLNAHGPAVGLPGADDMGNSEVGHNALGSGRIVRQGAGLVDDSLASGAITRTETWAWLGEAWRSRTLHLLGLLSDGGVHSRMDQLQALMVAAADHGAQRMRLHILLDGRDVPDHSALDYVETLEQSLAKLRGQGCDARIASGGGRMEVTMDRYESDWAIVERGWRAHVLGKAPRFESASEAISALRAHDPGVSDQQLPAFVVAPQGEPSPVDDGDAVVCFNFRGDRVLQISRAFEQPDFSAFERERVPDVRYAGIMQYDGDAHIPKRFLVDPPLIRDTAGELLVQAEKRSFACSETQKFGHVTYFWNGNRSGAFDESLESYLEVPSKPPPFNADPAMGAAEIARQTVEAITKGCFDHLRVNFANGDMVGHTGDLDATVLACEAVDSALATLLDAITTSQGRYIVTADHGNADDMVLRDASGAPKAGPDNRPLPRTSHTLAPVPFVVGGALPSSLVLRKDLPEAGLANVTATYLGLMGLKPPSSWEPELMGFR